MTYNGQWEGVDIPTRYAYPRLLMPYYLLQVSDVIHPSSGRCNNAMSKAMHYPPLVMDVSVWDVKLFPDI